MITNKANYAFFWHIINGFSNFNKKMKKKHLVVKSDLKIARYKSFDYYVR